MDHCDSTCHRKRGPNRHLQIKASHLLAITPQLPPVVIRRRTTHPHTTRIVARPKLHTARLKSLVTCETPRGQIIATLVLMVQHHGTFRLKLFTRLFRESNSRNPVNTNLKYFASNCLHASATTTKSNRVT